VPLSDIAGMTESDENVEQALSTLDAEDTERGGVRPGTARRDAAGGTSSWWRIRRMTGRERVPPLPPEERDERQAALVAAAGAEFGVYTTLVRHTELFADLLPFGQRLLERSTLELRDRELLILRVAWRCGASYVWSHHAAAVTDADLAALVDSASGEVLLRAADELVVSHRVSDEVWAELGERYSSAQLIEVCLLVGQYVMLAGALNSLGVQLEDGFSLPEWG
jgi:alkylhydroperoxidase family enzyme